MSHTDRQPARLAALLLALLATVAIAGCGGQSAGAEGPRQPAAAASVATPLPTSVRLPSIGARSSLVQLGLNKDHTVQVPPVDEPLQAGWYKFSARPGNPGPAVILGHIDGHHRKGIFWKLDELKAGDDVRVGRQDGSVLDYTVTKVRQVPKRSFPTDAVYGDTRGSELRLITCGGEFDASARSYVDNIIVDATLNS